MLILSTLELIERTTKAIGYHQSFESPDRLAIDQYTELRERHLAFLAELLEDFGVEAHLSVRQAA
ncbi:hypothetical protein [Larkinella soli]|uniref:hypothetical protein n=1 Tax=Larkinella soli TaxID=1770527 RepID=UPI0019D045FD|nr:hypothetical protein [Larkinella soli]